MTLREIIKLIMVSYPRQEFTDDNVKAYAMMLSDVDTDLLQAAAVKHIATSKWFPTVAELRSAATSLVLASSNTLSAPEAWGMVKQEIRNVGHWGTPDFPELTSKAVHAIGGWKDVCLSENIAADRARFIQAYEIIIDRKSESIQLPPVVNQAVARLAAQNKERVDSEIKGLLETMTGRR